MILLSTAQFQHLIYNIATLRISIAVVLAITFWPALVFAHVKPRNSLLLLALKRTSIKFLSCVACIAGFQVTFASQDISKTNEAETPLLRSWISPLEDGWRILSFEQPGRWMSDDQLSTLNDWLRGIASKSIANGKVPSHVIFSRKRSVLQNRIISFGFHEGIPVAFTAMVYLPIDNENILHLGLAMIESSIRGKRLQSRLFKRALLMSLFNQGRARCIITNIAGSPAGIGSVSDYFMETFPHYAGTLARRDWHLRVARQVLSRHRHEFGCSLRASFDEESFVVYGSNMVEGGGAAELISKDGKPVSHYKNPACNRYVKKILDLSAGDELFQVGKVNLVGSYLKYCFPKSTWLDVVLNNTL